MSCSTSHHMVLGLATNDVYNNGLSGPSLGRLLSHRIGVTKLLSDGDYRDYIVYAQCGLARRGVVPHYPLPTHPTPPLHKPLT